MTLAASTAESLMEQQTGSGVITSRHFTGLDCDIEPPVEREMANRLPLRTFDQKRANRPLDHPADRIPKKLPHPRRTRTGKIEEVDKAGLRREAGYVFPPTHARRIVPALGRQK
jgi:hypothetical protein